MFRKRAECGINAVPLGYSREDFKHFTTDML